MVRRGIWCPPPEDVVVYIPTIWLIGAREGAVSMVNAGLNAAIVPQEQIRLARW